MTKPNLDYKPWEEYPDLWETEAQWWTFLRGALRRGLWEKSPVKFKFKAEQCTPPPLGYKGKGRKGAICALTGEWSSVSHSEVDHIVGHIPLLKWEDVMPYIHHLVPKKGELQYVNKEAHKIKSYAERMGISFEDAVIAKQAIAIQKVKGADVKWLKSKGLTPSSNATKRKQQIIDWLNNN